MLIQPCADSVCVCVWKRTLGGGLHAHFWLLQSLNLTRTFFLHFSWQTIRISIRNIVKVLMKRFRWRFILAGFAALTMAAVSWKLETSQSYWIWHRWAIYPTNIGTKTLNLTLVPSLQPKKQKLKLWCQMFCSIWHVSIYTSSFLFLCSMVKPAAPSTENVRPQNGDYELTRQNSVPRGGE